MVSRSEWQGSKAAYDIYMDEQGIPVVEGWSVPDVRSIDLKPWRRLGGKGAFVQLYGQEYITGMYVVEVPPGSALNIEQHLYEEQYYILEGNGSTEVWTPDGKPQRFGWGRDALFAIPLNAPHRLINDSAEPVLALASTNAPIMMDHFHNPTFIFECDFKFTDRYSGAPDHFDVNENFEMKPGQNGRAAGVNWETNIIPSIRTAPMGFDEYKGGDFHVGRFQMSDNVLVGHYMQWSGGQYMKAHAHGGGAVLMGLEGKGYTLIWPQQAGIRPYENGNDDQVVRADWTDGTLFSPGSGWYHQHCATSPEDIRIVAFRYGTPKYGVGFHRAASGAAGPRVSIRLGGSLVDFDMEDPKIRADFKAELTKNGATYKMPADDELDNMPII